ncbi:MAG: dimethylsulfoxide reductase subunit B [Anaerolineales bacterium]|nr:dimethylsulfoxide reductase subunit B [Anaerolineales bacterium]
MNKRYGFYIDTRSCTGCKACQIACKDKNNLPVGVLWRRVVEVQGGEWLPRGEAWLTNVFAYFISAACMHCELPICAEVCPTQAITQRDDGIVTIDSERCMGCRYCEMACPYKAPQFDPAQGLMTKCDFCSDLIDEGKSPACVTACQMRVLHFGDIDELRVEHGRVADVYPLPDPRLTKPALVLTPHPDAARGVGRGAKIGNQEEI